MTNVSDLLAKAQPGAAWILDRDRSTVAVRNKTFWGAVTVKGTFSDIEGSGEITAANTIAGQLRVGAASVSTGIGKRDDHLRSADFFEVENHPVIAIEVHGATVTGADTLDLDATITVKRTARRTHPARHGEAARRRGGTDHHQGRDQPQGFWRRRQYGGHDPGRHTSGR